jgi:uncharacterized repeat protein (TIGR01451 family)
MLLGWRAFGQSPYTYQVVLDSANPVAGKTVTNILAMDVDEGGNVAVLANFVGGTGIWTSAQNAWVVTTGQAITTASGYPSTIGGLGGPIFGPNGVLEYSAGFSDINPNTHVGWPSVQGFFNNGQLIYELIDPNLVDCCAFQTPSQSVIYVSSPGTNILILSGTLNGPTVRLPPMLQFDTIYSFTGNKTTGHYAFQGVSDNGDGTTTYSVFLNGTVQAATTALGTQSGGLGSLFLNANDDLATNLGSATYVNGIKSTKGNGTLLAINANDDLLLNQPSAQSSAGQIAVNNSLVIEFGNAFTWVQGQPVWLGLPNIPSRGWLWDYKLPVMNNERQVAFAADFLPVTATEEVPNPWVVILATPNAAYMPLQVTTTSLPDAVSGQPYNAALSATGGGPPYTWTSLGLPAGFGIVNGAIVSTGQIAVAPKTYTVIVAVTDSNRLTATATLSLVVGPMAITAVDPYPSLLPAPFLQSPSVLATGGRQVMGIAADGVAEVILRINSNAPLMLTVASGDGGLTGVGASASSGFNTQVVVNPVNAGSAGSMVFAVLQAPIDFVRPGSSGDATVTSRALAVNVLSGDGGTAIQTFSLKLVRPPVVLVHGFTSTPSYWDGFTPLVSGAANPIPPSTGDPRFFLRRADYSHDVTIFYDLELGDDITVKASDLGFQYNAGPVFNQFEAFLQEYRQLAPQGSVPVAAAQVDVVGHSMGGLITRTMPYVLTSQFYSAENYMQGIVHKLIAIGGPHLGSPLAISSLAPTNTCTQIGQALEGDPPISTVTIDGVTYTGGAADLEGDGQGGCMSPALQLLQSPSNNPPMLVSLVAGNVSEAQLSTFGISPQVAWTSVLADHFCSNDYGVQDYSAQGWLTLVGTPASCASSIGAPTCSDAVVPMTSAADGLGYGSSCQATAVAETNACLSVSPVTNCQNQVTLVQGVVHGPGTLELGFPPPHLQECHSSVPLRTIDLLNASVSSPEFGVLPSYPNAPACQVGTSSSSATPHSSSGATASAGTAPTLILTAPGNNTTIAPGQTVTVTATLSAPSNYSQVAIFGPSPIGMAAFATAGAAMTFTFTAPSSLPVGTYPIRALAYPSTSTGTPVASSAVNLLVEVNPTPVSLWANPALLTFRLVGDILPLDILAAMPDGSSQDVSRAPQMTWTSDTAQVATVSADGLVTAVAPGMANITATLGNQSVKVPVVVNLAPPNPCVYTLASPSATADPNGDSLSVNVTAGSTCSWSAASWVPWILVSDGSPAMGVGTVTLTVSENDGATSRSGTVQIAGQNFTVNQASTISPALGIFSYHQGSFIPGAQAANYYVVIYNAGGTPTSGMVTVTDMLPTGLTLVSMAGTGWSCSGNSCTRSDTLAVGGLYPLLIVTVSVAANAPPQVTNQVSVSGGGLIGANASDVTTIGFTTAVLSISKIHTGSFQPGQNGAVYSVVVSNSGLAVPSSGTVTVTETIPTGLTLFSMAGTGWGCTGNTCTRTDPLSPGSSYPAITVTVNVSANASSSVANQVSVSGGGSASASAQDVTVIGVTNSCDLQQNGNINVADVQLSINEALGLSAAVNDLNADGVVNVMDVQIEINAVLSGSCTLQ